LRASNIDAKNELEINIFKRKIKTKEKRG